MHAIPPGYSPVWVLSGPPRDSTRFGFCLGVFSFLGFQQGVSAMLVEIGTYLVVQQGVQSMQASVDFWPSTTAAPDRYKYYCAKLL